MSNRITASASPTRYATILLKMEVRSSLRYPIAAVTRISGHSSPRFEASAQMWSFFLLIIPKRRWSFVKRDNLVLARRLWAGRAGILLPSFRLLEGALMGTTTPTISLLQILRSV